MAMARRLILGTACLGLAAGLSACGDAGLRREAASGALGRWLGAEASVSSVGPAGEGGFEARGIAWKGGLPGRAAFGDVVQGQGAAPAMATLRDARIGTGLAAGRMSVEPGRDGSVSYRLDRGRLDAWSVALEFGEAVVEPRGADRVGIRLREVRLAGGARREGVAGAVLGRAFGDGPVSGEVLLSRLGGEVEAEGRLVPEGPGGGPPGRQVTFRVRLAVPGAGLAPFMADEASLVRGRAVFAPGPDEPMPVEGEAGLAEAVATVAASVEVSPAAAVPLTAVEPGWDGLVADGAVRVTRPAQGGAVTSR